MSFPHIDLAANAHDRAGVRRYDEQWLADTWADPSSRVLVISGTRLRPIDGRVEWVRTADVPAGRRILLGERNGVTWWACLVDPVDAPGERGEWIGLRQAMMGSMAGVFEDSPLVFHAVGLAEWHHAHRHCPRCGAQLEVRAAGHELVCVGCGKAQFPRTDPAVIMTVTHGEPGSPDEVCLLGRQASWPTGRYSTLAGFVEPGETLEDAVRREVWEEAGVRVGPVDYFGNQPWPFPASLMLGLVGRAEARELDVDHDELEDARWFTRAELRAGAADGSIVVPSGISISSALVQSWLGEPLAGTW